MTTYTLNLTNDNTESQKALVFLKAQPPLRDYQTHAWQALTGPTGSSESFNYAVSIETDVTATGALPGNTLGPDQLTIAPGVRLQPFAPADQPSAPQQPTPPPFGTNGQATAYPPLERNWYVDVRPASGMPTVDLSYEYSPSFSFTLANPPSAESAAASATETPPPGSEEP